VSECWRFVLNDGASFRDENDHRLFAGEFQQFSKEAAELLLELGIIKQMPDLTTIVDTTYVK
jgi:NitT/TauT family transport system substrate-binding protein